MGHTRLTILVEDLANLAGAIPGGKSCPSIELLLARGRFHRAPDLNADGQRMSLFGLPDGEVPVAALTRLAEGDGPMPAGRYWLRADAVSQRADMIRVFMTGAGLEGLTGTERQGICRCIEQVFDDEGLEHHAGAEGRWTLALESQPEFSFLPLEEALGLDMADALPEEPEARDWRRIMNEVQVALHNHPVNIARRQSGELLVNGCWIWGGGFLPASATENLFDAVFSVNPVSCGLALLNDIELRDLRAFDSSGSVNGGRVLLDWTVESRDAGAELDRLESLCEGLLFRVRKGSLAIFLAGPDGLTWEIDRRSLRRFWRKKAPLPELIERVAS